MPMKGREVIIAATATTQPLPLPPPPSLWSIFFSRSVGIKFVQQTLPFSLLWGWTCDRRGPLVPQQRRWAGCGNFWIQNFSAENPWFRIEDESVSLWTGRKIQQQNAFVIYSFLAVTSFNPSRFWFSDGESASSCLSVCLPHYALPAQSFNTKIRNNLQAQYRVLVQEKVLLYCEPGPCVEAGMMDFCFSLNAALLQLV